MRRGIGHPARLWPSQGWVNDLEEEALKGKDTNEVTVPLSLLLLSPKKKTISVIAQKLPRRGFFSITAFIDSKN